MDAGRGGAHSGGVITAHAAAVSPAGQNPHIDVVTAGRSGQPDVAAASAAQAKRASAPEAVCIVWSVAAEGVPAALASSLQRQGATIAACASAYEVLARAGSLSGGGGGSVGGSAGNAGRAVIVILVEPSRLREPAALVRALRRYAPRSAAWAFEARATPPLRAVRGHDLAAWDARAQTDELTNAVRADFGAARPELGAGRVTRPRPASPPALRLVSHDDDGAAPHIEPKPTTMDAPSATSLPQAPAPGAAPAASAPSAFAGPSPLPLTSPAQEDHPAPPVLTAEEIAMLLGDAFGDGGRGPRARGRPPEAPGSDADR